MKRLLIANKDTIYAFVPEELLDLNSFDGYELLILPFGKEVSVLNFL